MKRLTLVLLAGLIFGIHCQTAQDLVDELEDLADDIETLCASSAASLPEVEAFCDYALGDGPDSTGNAVHLSPVNLQGCMEADGTSSGSGLTLDTCDSSEGLQKFKYDGEKFYLDKDPTKCLQAGHSSEPPVDGGMMRVKRCEDDESLQLFSWIGSASGSAITPTAYPDFCVVSRGHTANLGDDPIITKLCDSLEQGRLDGWKVV